jgi:hypothetical protein
MHCHKRGESSSRRIEQATYDDVAFRYLAADQHHDHDTIASFRQQHLESLGRLFVQALQLCQKAGLVKLGHVAIDGTKMEANASRHKSMSYERNAGQRPEVVTADAGYWDTEAVQQAIHGGAQVLVPPDGAVTLKARQPRQMTNNPRGATHARRASHRGLRTLSHAASHR